MGTSKQTTQTGLPVINYSAVQSPGRDHSIDFLRGSAVLFMIITHVNSFFYGKTGTWLDWLTWWGATICFTVFLFVSGSVSGMTIKKGTMTFLRAFKRSFHLLGVYYLIAFLMAYFNENVPSTLETVADILTFRLIPEFTEFLLPFIFFPMIVAVIHPVLKKNKRNPLFLVSLSLLAYALAAALYKVNWGSGYVAVVKSILVGDGDLHRFPLLSYFPVYTIGMWWGLRSRENKREERKMTWTVLLFSVSVYLVLLVAGLSGWERWPPSLLFFAYGFMYIFGVILVHEYLHRFKHAHELVAFLGYYAISYYVYHLVVLLLIKNSILTGQLDEITTIAVIVFTFIETTIFVFIANAKKLFSAHR